MGAASEPVSPVHRGGEGTPRRGPRGGPGGACRGAASDDRCVGTGADARVCVCVVSVSCPVPAPRSDELSYFIDSILAASVVKNYLTEEPAIE